MGNNNEIGKLLQEALDSMNRVKIDGEMNMNNQLLAFIKIREAMKLTKEGQADEKRDNA